MMVYSSLLINLNNYIHTSIHTIWGGNTYISYKYKAESSQTVAQNNALKRINPQDRRAVWMLGSCWFMGGEVEGPARKAGSGPEILKMSRAAIFLTCLL